MKIRQGFVSNSSSSSFYIQQPKEHIPFGRLAEYYGVNPNVPEEQQVWITLCIWQTLHNQDMYEKSPDNEVLDNRRPDALTDYLSDSNIEWTFEAPEGTACEVLIKIGNGDFLKAENGGKIPGLADGTDLTSTPMTVRVSLSTENPEVTPAFHSLSLWVADEYDTNVISLHFPPGNQNSVQNAAAPITVAYNGATLAGDGGFVQAFELDCLIDGLEYKGDQNDAEHIEIKSIQATGELKRVYYRDYSGGAEHIELASVTATGTLTHVNDI